MPVPNNPLITFDAVGRAYPGRRGHESVQALAGLSFSVGPGQIAAVVGPSGCGKSTLLELLCGLQQPDAGQVSTAPAALMAQRDLLLPWLSALDNAATALRIAGLDREAARDKARPWLEQLGLSGFEQAHPHELSGGMRQRVSFLRTLLAAKPVMALDEPFAALDAITRAESQRWLQTALRADPRTVVLVTHDVEEAILLADRILVMSPRPGRIIADVEVPLRRPRHRGDPDVIALRSYTLDELGIST
jgi:ABC-type nitrate/sulfonate/bicarbonate transport system ATPase subunit